jgi:uncharacterized protein YecT (DUF1311 family)
MMAVVKALGLAALAMVAPVPAQGAAVPDGTYPGCLGRSDATQSWIRACIAVEEHRVDAELNDVYRDLLGATPRQGRVGVVTAQRAWIGFRDAECAMRRDRRGAGADWAVAMGTCTIDLASARIRDLRNLARR